ncbi:tyrosine--tRNA ligase [Brevundimonas sp. Root1279]|uniref:tyrosine--tRNA ligase n=1 Tax=Brevundimonas sp. Root1279 TaxID=1736443 RepID=UPI0006FE6BCC|nr:tyrosine--tRNA ligase [Brevundimonas sp. Root1279]KQW83618.1 tyrosine--tRNA ligase [Brevundimonas sp. Root1279]
MTDTAFKSDFLRTLQARGYVHQITHPAELDEAASNGVVTAYIGFDATAPSLHVGSLIQIMMLRRLQQAGHKPIVLMGGGTTKVGDPTGKDASRPHLTDETIQANIASIKTVFEKFLTFGDGPTDAVMLDNDAWLSGYGYIQFLRDFGTHFTVNRMLAFDSVKLRLEREQPMTFLEFNYMLMQSVDFLELNRSHNCTLQMGGSDQWGNITSGVDLVRRVDQKAAFGLTTPLLTTASGGKMGKTADGAVWLNAEQLPPLKYWQFWRKVEDADVGRFLRLFTDLPLEEIARLEALEGSGINDAKKALADAATALLHGSEAAAEARRTSEDAFERGVATSGLTTEYILWEGDLEEQERNNQGRPFTQRRVEALLKASKLSPSIGQARKKIENEGVWINDELVRDPGRWFSLEDVDQELGAFKVRLGKRGQIVLVRPVL